MWLTTNRARSSTHYGSGLAAAIVAAGAAYFLDPRSGRRRRALMRDQATRIAHQAQDFLAKAGRDARQRTRGVYEKSVSGFRPGVIDDGILEERIRSELGRLSSHPGAIDVSCSKGIVRLWGDILEEEVGTVVHGVSRVHGVRNVVNEMHARSEAGNVPSLQGNGNTRRASRFEYLQVNWSPAPRLLAGTAGFAMIAAGLARRSAPGRALAMGGAALLARSICNMPLSHLFGVRTSAADGVIIQKTIEVDVDADKTYARWRDLQSFPTFMSHVREVQKVDDTHYRWKVDGPAGVPVEWDAVITADVPAELIAWRTLQGASVQSSGVVQFEPTGYGGTRVHVRMSYLPPANAIGRTVAKVFGRDPKRQIGADLMRFKKFIETGRAPDAAAGATRH